MSTTPPEPAAPTTQSKHPWRATVRTIFAMVVGLAASWSLVVPVLGLNPNWQWVAVASLVAGGITRAMANPAVDLFLQRFVPWLSAQPKPKPEHLA